MIPLITFINLSTSHVTRCDDTLLHLPIPVHVRRLRRGTLGAELIKTERLTQLDDGDCQYTTSDDVELLRAVADLVSVCGDRVQNFTKAGALLAAAIDHL